MGKRLAPLPVESLRKQLAANYRLEFFQKEAERLQKRGKISPEQAAEIGRGGREESRSRICRKREADKAIVAKLMPAIHAAGESKAAESWGILGMMGMNHWLLPIDDATRSPFAPYGFSGIMLGAAIVFFAFIGFDSISTHAEEAKKPQRDVPIGILTSLLALHGALHRRGVGDYRHDSLSGRSTPTRPSPPPSARKNAAAARRRSSPSAAWPA